MSKKKQHGIYKKVVINTAESMSIEDLATLITDSIDIEDTPVLIAMIDRLSEDWGVTMKVCQHFKRLEMIYMNEVKEEKESASDFPPVDLLEGTVWAGVDKEYITKH